MTHTITTTLSAEELSAIIVGAISKAIVQLPEVSHTNKNPITRRELMNKLNVSEPTIIRWERKGVIPCMRLGSNVRYDWDAVIKSLEGKKKGK